MQSLSCDAFAFEAQEHFVAFGGEIDKRRRQVPVEMHEERGECLVDQGLFGTVDAGNGRGADDRPLHIVGDDVEERTAVALFPGPERLADNRLVVVFRRHRVVLTRLARRSCRIMRDWGDFYAGFFLPPFWTTCILIKNYLGRLEHFRTPLIGSRVIVFFGRAHITQYTSLVNKSKTFRTINELAQETLALHSSGDPIRIGIDGLDGVGKTPFVATPLAKAINASVVSLDDHLVRNKNVYVDALRCEDVRRAAELRVKHVIIEGVCLRAAAARCRFEVDFHVYVKRIEKDGSWDDEELCLGLAGAEAVIARDIEIRKMTAAAFGHNRIDRPLFDELAHYHESYRPVEKADVIYEMVSQA